MSERDSCLGEIHFKRLSRSLCLYLLGMLRVFRRQA